MTPSLRLGTSTVIGLVLCTVLVSGCSWLQGVQRPRSTDTTQVAGTQMSGDASAGAATGTSATQSITATGDSSSASSTISGARSRSAVPDDIVITVLTQQQESRENMRRLAEGQIRRIEIRSVSKAVAGSRTVRVSTVYADRTSIQGSLGFVSVSPTGTSWVLVSAISDSTISPTGYVATIGGAEMSLGRKMVQEQMDAQAQKYVMDLFAKKIRYVDFRSLSTGARTVRIATVWTYRTGKKVKATIEMRQLNGFWYMTRVLSIG